MADTILLAGSCQKQNFFSMLKNAMIAAGWVDVSSLATSDYSVMKSTGNDGTRELYLQMRPQNVNNTNSIETTDYCQMSFRLLDSYTPGATGVAGTIPRSAQGWWPLNLIPTYPTTYTVPMTSTFDYKLFVDKNKVVVCIFPPAAYNYHPCFHYIGLPDTTFSNEPLSRGMVACTNITENYPTTTGNTIMVSNTPGGAATVAAPYVLSIYSQKSPKNPNSAGSYMISEIFYGSATEGIRGKLDEIYCMPNQNLVDKDIITIGTKKYQVLINPGCFNDGAICFRIQ